MAAYIAVVDYHKGNLLSVERALVASGAQVLVTDDPALIEQAAAAVVPGVGAFDDAMTYMCSSGQDEAIRRLVASGRALLGICLGMQLLFDRGNEHAEPPAFGEVPEWVPGLGILRGEVRRLDGRGVKVPHVGWNAADFTASGERCPLFDGVAGGTDSSQVVATTEHGTRFASAVWDGRLVFGTQFHPEKSSAAGQRVMSNFTSLALRSAL